MFYLIQNGRLVPSEETAEDIRRAVRRPEEVRIYVDAYQEGEIPKRFDSVPAHSFREIFRNQSPRFESHENFDLICMDPVRMDARAKLSTAIYIFIESSSLHFYCREPALVTDVFQKVMDEGMTSVTPGSLLCFFFSHQIAEDLEYLEKFEMFLNQLEDQVLTHHSEDNYSRKIITLRKQLMRIKQHYEQLLNILDGINANENSILDKHALKQFHIFDGKTERLYRKVLDLMEYMTQIREAYQAEVDISLNKTMKLLTVITVIVLPLTLIAGWYGMNFNMPEYGSSLGYPVVIGVSLLIVAGCVAYFKKHDWF